MSERLYDGPKAGEPVLILAHGAGAPMDSPFMNRVAEGLGEAGLRVVRFEFPYMAERRKTGKKRPPNAQSKLLDAFRAVVAEEGPASRCVIGGKSMGGRMATMLADELGARGAFALGYPFHPPGKPDKLRTEHLIELRTPTLILQGERDTFGSRGEVDDYGLSAAIRIEWLSDGDHSLKPRVRSGVTEEENLKAAVEHLSAFSLRT